MCIEHGLDFFLASMIRDKATVVDVNGSYKITREAFWMYTQDTKDMPFAGGCWDLRALIL
jgi:hypothetical protein